MPCSARPAARNREQQSTAGQTADLGNEAVPAGLRPKTQGQPTALQHPLPSPPSLVPLTSSKAALGWSVPLGDSRGMTLTPLWQKMTSDDNGDRGAGPRAESWPSSQNTPPGLKGAKLFKGRKKPQEIATELPCSLKTHFRNQITNCLWDGNKDPSGASLPCTFSCQAPVIKGISKALKGHCP